jgi:hypothetical protein
MEKMKTDHRAAYDILYGIYQTHRRKYRENSHDSGQMCLMWSTDDPPDIIEDTPPFDDIADAFGITIDWEDALELYDMRLNEATTRLTEMQQRQCQSGPRD